MTLLLDAFVAAVGVALAWYGWPMVPVAVFAGVLFGVTGALWLVTDAWWQWSAMAERKARAMRTLRAYADTESSQQ